MLSYTMILPPELCNCPAEWKNFINSLTGLNKVRGSNDGIINEALKEYNAEFIHRENNNAAYVVFETLDAVYFKLKFG